jgi:hypothetical protein
MKRHGSLCGRRWSAVSGNEFLFLSHVFVASPGCFLALPLTHDERHAFAQAAHEQLSAQRALVFRRGQESRRSG